MRRKEKPKFQIPAFAADFERMIGKNQSLLACSGLEWTFTAGKRRGRASGCSVDRAIIARNLEKTKNKSRIAFEFLKKKDLSARLCRGKGGWDAAVDGDGKFCGLEN